MQNIPEPEKKRDQNNIINKPHQDMKAGVLLVNLGTPSSYSASDIRRYLAEFLSDKRVVELPSLLWQPILRGVILPFRSRKLVHKYQQVWMEGGSPLLVHSLAQAQKLADGFARQNLSIPVELAMRYGKPSLAAAIESLRQQHCERILVVPMYPQYAASTTATILDKIARIVADFRDQPEFRFIKRFYNEPGYIMVLLNKIRTFWQVNGKPQRLLLSFHGLPQRSVDQGDPYYKDCKGTVHLLKQALADEGVEIDFSFQSRFGAQKWLEPATQETLESYPAKGVKRVDVICPGFVADCLETLEEIQLECASEFKKAGGEQFRYIPCLNSDEEWVNGLDGIVKRHLQGWCPELPNSIR